MQANQNQKLSMKDRITAHLPGHKNQDNNANGIPDRLEKNTATGHRTLSDTNGNGVPDRLERNTGAPLGSGASIIPGTTATTTTTSITKDVNGLPIRGNILEDKTITSSTVSREPALVHTAPYSQQPNMTDLNRNGIPDQLEGQGFGFIGSVSANQTSVANIREAPTMVERIEKPAIVHEVYKTEEVVQIQPIIEREREQLDVYEVVQPIREREVIATEVRSVALPAQTRATIVEDNSAFLTQRSMPGEFSTREVAVTRSQVIENAPIIHETIVHKVIEEVQPVIYKEIDRPILIKETLPIYEKIVEAPHSHHTMLPMRDLGVRSVPTTTTTGFTDLNRDGIPDQLQGGRYQTTGLQSGLQSQGTFATQSGLSPDLNRNGIPDQYERSSGFQQGSIGGLQGGLNDRNGNGIPDQYERSSGFQQGSIGGLQGGLNDRNGNGIPDQYERSSGFQQGSIGGLQGGLNDRNGNGIPDQYERSSGFQQGPFGGLQGGLNDRNGNGIPDNMEGRQRRSLHDINGNGIPDRMEKAHGLKDLNGNGIDDSLERRMGSTSLNANTRV